MILEIEIEKERDCLHMGKNLHLTAVCFSSVPLNYLFVSEEDLDKGKKIFLFFSPPENLIELF